MLALTDRPAGYGGITALHGITLAVEEGTIVTLIGANGAGKTTTLRAISGLVRAKGGRITFAGQEIANQRPHKIVARGIAHSPEGRMVFANLTVRENLTATARRAAKGETRWMLSSVMELFPWMNERSSQLGASLSGGEQQMLAIGRALLTNPQLLILDEATAAVDVETDELIQRTIREEFKDRTVLTIAHRIKTVMDSDRILVMDQGRVVEFEAPRVLLPSADSLFFKLAPQAGEIAASLYPPTS